ncbi:hypothetical protein ACFLS0_07180 [Candidatus Bipolaricaulota bacterium]
MPNGYTARPATLDDINAIANLVNQYTLRLIGEPYLPVEHLHKYLTVPGLNVATSSQLVFSPQETLAGFALMMDIQSPYVKITGWGFVPEAEQGKGIGVGASWMDRAPCAASHHQGSRRHLRVHHPIVVRSG